MTTRYVIRCTGCGERAPLTGDLLNGMSQQVVAFQADHGHATSGVLVDRVPALLMHGGTAPAPVEAQRAAQPAA